MIEEDYVSFETAKLLKEKGFDEDCYTCYLIDEIQHYDYKSRNRDLIEGVISAPTLQMAMKWLREVHKIQCVIMYRESGYYEPQIFCLDEWINEKELDGCFSYEQACESAIRYCLENLI